jgi:ribosome-associated toxin RatA of RatAB toxin-antitoxin module
MPGPRLALSAAVLGAALALAPAVARADGLTAEEHARLEHGETVVRTQTLEDDSRRLVGGVTYTIVDASQAELERLLDDVAAYRRLLPLTKDARRIGVDHGDTLVWLRQGTSFVETSYTVRVHKEPKTGTVRFWLDKTRPHGIDDAWGFFRAQPLEGDGSRVLLTYGVLVDMGDGLGRALFEERVRRVMLSVPELLVRYLAEAHGRLAAF